MEQTIKCYDCGSTMHRGIVKESVTYGAETLYYDLPGWFCSSCPESVHNGRDLANYNECLKELKSRHPQK